MQTDRHTSLLLYRAAAAVVVAMLMSCMWWTLHTGHCGFVRVLLTHFSRSITHCCTV